MANHKQAKKRNRQRIKITAANRHRRSTVRTFVKNVRSKIDEGSPEEAREALGVAIRHIDKAAGKGLFHRKAAARKISRLTVAVNKMSQ